MSTHGPVQAEYREKMNALAQVIDEFFNGKERPKRVGFAMLIFEFGPEDRGRVNYISNAERKDMLVAMKEFIARAEGFDPDDTGAVQ
jgi:hypothetical protein